ncbi:MAG: DUF971 domain-containing protein [Gammaproteobacteria bacterium]|nr:DUF971 domain-containing protein [Gammaproteobacteria bacterium]
MKEHNPIAINLHKKSRLLEIIFDTGENFKLSCEYLRTHAKSAEVTESDVPITGKINVNIDSIEAQGTYAIRIFFNDGYDQGIYSWQTLYDLGQNYEKNWALYLFSLDEHQLNRGDVNNTHKGPSSIKILYFMDKLIKFTKEEEEFELPDDVKTVEQLLNLLRTRGNRWKRAFENDAIQFTVNKEFAELFTVLEHGDEVALIPKSK